MPRALFSIALALATLLLAGCAPREGFGIVEGTSPEQAPEPWRVSEATLFIAETGPEQDGAEFLIPDLHATRSTIRLEAVSRRSIAATLACEGPFRIQTADGTARRFSQGRWFSRGLLALGLISGGGHDGSCSAAAVGWPERASSTSFRTSA